VSGVLFEIWALAWVVYVAGVVWGLVVIDATPATKIALSLVWPLGPLAFAVTLTLLVVASLVAFPAFGLAVLITAAAAWLFVM
jgi:hypothetical protein